jgi:outer membrane protein assembly factor BamB
MRALRHPAWWIALVVLVVNDHALKGAGLLPAAITGKLSDFAGLIVAPIVLAALCRARSRRGAAAAVVAVGVWFALVKALPPAAAAWEQLTALAGVPWRLVADPTDLIALPMAWVGWRLLLATASEEAPRPATTLERALAMAGAVACMATSYQQAAPVRSVDGKLLAHGYGRGPVFVIEPATGRRLASPEVDDQVLDVVAVDGRIYAATSRAVRGFGIKSGAEKLTYVHEGAQFYRRILSDGDRLFLATTRASGSSHEELVAIDIASQKLLWRAPLPTDDNWRGPSTLPILEGGLLIATAGQELVAHDPVTGKRRWRHRATSELAWPTVHGRLVYAVDAEGTIIALDVASGRVEWRHPVGTAEGFDPTGALGPRLGAGEGVLAFIRGTQLVGIDAQTRGPRWQGPAVDNAAIGKTVIVAQLADDDFHVGIDIASGRELWRAEDMGGGGPVIADGEGLVLFHQGNDLVAYELRSGKLRWRFDFEAGDRSDDLVGAVVFPRAL